MLTIGLDTHETTSTVCILDAQGKRLGQKTIPGRWPKLMEFLDQIDQPYQICYEASCSYGHLYDKLVVRAQRVLVAHPGHLRLVFHSKKKSDRVDAQKLAQLALVGAIRPVHVPDMKVRDWRRMIEYRQGLIRQIVAVKNRLRALLRAHGIKAARGLWTRRGLEWLAAAELPSPASAMVRDMDQDELRGLTAKLSAVTKELDKIADSHQGVKLLQTIRGVGPRTAEAFVAYVDDPQRFARTRQIGAYLGLVPRLDSSSSVTRLGHITKDGPATVRKLLVEASWQVMRHCPAVRERFERIAGGKRDRRKIALIAVAHYLARCMLAMLRSGETWREACCKVE